MVAENSLYFKNDAARDKSPLQLNNIFNDLEKNNIRLTLLELTELDNKVKFIAKHECPPATDSVSKWECGLITGGVSVGVGTIVFFF